MPKKKPTRTQQVNRADRLFSLIVRSAGFCVGCGKTSDLQCAHGFSRRHRATRWDFRNAFPLCRGCHVYWTHRPLEWDEWLRERWGDDQYWDLRRLALSDRRPDLDGLLEDLSVRWAEIEAAA